MVSEQEIIEVLKNVVDPEIGADIVFLEMVRDIKIDGNKVELTIDLTVPGCPLASYIANDARERVLSLDGVDDVKVYLGAMTREKLQKVYEKLMRERERRMRELQNQS